jgi:hypothetical protein
MILAIDWAQAFQSTFLIVPTALISGYVGTKVKQYLDRAKPEVSVVGCRIPGADDVVGLSINVPSEITDQLRQLAWTGTLYGTVSAAKLKQKVHELEQLASQARRALNVVELALDQLATVASAGKTDKARFVDMLSRLDLPIIHRAFSGGLAREEVTLELGSKVLKPEEQVFPFSDHSCKDGEGYSIDLGLCYYNFVYSQGRSKPLLLPGVHAVCWFHQPSLEKLLKYAREQLLLLLTRGPEMAKGCDQILSEVQPLVVEVSVFNKGSSPALFSPWAVLHLASDNSGINIPLISISPTWRPIDPIAAHRHRTRVMELPDLIIDKQQSISVSGGTTQRFCYHSTESQKTLETKFRNLEDILALDMFKCQVMVRRLDGNRGSSSWIPSTIGTFGKREQAFPQDEIRLLRWADLS